MIQVHVNISDDPDTPQSLCGLKRGEFVKDNLRVIAIYGNVPAEVTCERCKHVARYLKHGRPLASARTTARKFVSER